MYECMLVYICGIICITIHDVPQVAIVCFPVLFINSSLQNISLACEDCLYVFNIYSPLPLQNKSYVFLLILLGVLILWVCLQWSCLVSDTYFKCNLCLDILQTCIDLVKRQSYLLSQNLALIMKETTLCTVLFMQLHAKYFDKPTNVPAVEVEAPGASYNPSFEDHQVRLNNLKVVTIVKLKL